MPMTNELPMAGLGHAIEICSILLFGWCWLQGPEQGKDIHVEMVVAFLYGLVLETFDMWIFGTYHYGLRTWLWIGHVPLYIPLLWATIMHSSMALSDRTGLPLAVRPFLDGILSVLIDLAVDATAIRAGLWHWSIPLNQGWFGVPAGNLCAWMWVAFWYGAVMRFVRGRIHTCGEPIWHRFLVPPIAYAGLLLSLSGIDPLARWLGLVTQNQRLWLFALQVLVFLFIVLISHHRAAILPSTSRIPKSLLWNRWIIHVSFWGILVVGGIWRQVPALIVVSTGAIVLEAFAQRWCSKSPQAGFGPCIKIP